MTSAYEWAIRDARGLTSMEKLAMYIIGSRGDDFHASMASLAEDMSCSRSAASRTVRGLRAKGLVVEAYTSQSGVKTYMISERRIIDFLTPVAEDHRGCGTDPQGVWHRSTGGVAQEDTKIEQEEETEERTEERARVRGLRVVQ